MSAIGAEDKRTDTTHAAASATPPAAPTPLLATTTTGREGFDKKDDMEAGKGGKGGGGTRNGQDLLDGVSREGSGWCLEEVYELLIERSSRMYEYDQVYACAPAPAPLLMRVISCFFSKTCRRPFLCGHFFGIFSRHLFIA